MQTAPVVKADRAAIKAQLRRLCPVPLTADTLDALADAVEQGRIPVPTAADVTRLDGEARACRGMK